MPWVKVSESRWDRPANGMESYFISIENLTASPFEGRHQYTINSRLKVDYDLSPSEKEKTLRHAWKQLRYLQPQIAATVEGVKKVYEIPDDLALESWLERIFIISNASDAEELSRDVSPILQATLYYLPRSSKLVIRAPHSLIEAVGMIMLWYSYLTVLTSPRPPRADIMAKAQEIINTFVTTPGIGPKNEVGKVAPGPTQRRELAFSVDTTQAIIACKNNGYSVTAAVHAAFIRTLVKQAYPAGDQAKYATATNYSLRDLLPEPYNSTDYAAALFYTPCAFSLDSPETFSETVRALDIAYKTTFRGNPENVELSGSVTRALYEKMQDPEVLAGPVPRDALVSSLGGVERHLQHSYGAGDGSVVVRDFKFGIEVVVGYSMFFFYTFRDQLRLIYSFNEASEDPDNIQTYLEDMRNILQDELRVQ
ncbi:hypothetical protein N7481_008933 [Penicillium waksmanii]|uniref:uncharacterized protein n=1 Tax=Penicillium waksmanii TaxID=69791 RepID=UPI002548E657|nr:uncharacterized protein N7481_008933 [Penicillium waksmanii]KAJ5975226.1 hypothetical protein N7481_008933 [Penicillium waksmanii]